MLAAEAVIFQAGIGDINRDVLRVSRRRRVAEYESGNIYAVLNYRGIRAVVSKRKRAVSAAFWGALVTYSVVFYHGIHSVGFNVNGIVVQIHHVVKYDGVAGSAEYGDGAVERIILRRAAGRVHFYIRPLHI